MASKKLLQIEQSIIDLSATEKLWLLERIARQLRALNEPASTHAAFAEMANDPEIQAEIMAINQEFAGTEWDGLQPA
jgi:hypothetical protein